MHGLQCLPLPLHLLLQLMPQQALLAAPGKAAPAAAVAAFKLLQMLHPAALQIVQQTHQQANIQSVVIHQP
jgi:hypothetical protein